MTNSSLQRETYEFIPVEVTLNSSPTITAVEFAIVAISDRPDTWQPATIIDGKTGVMVDGAALGVGTFRVFARITDDPEIPVIDCGTIRIV